MSGSTPLGWARIPSADDLMAIALENDSRNPSATAEAVRWLAAEVRALREHFTHDWEEQL